MTVKPSVNDRPQVPGPAGVYIPENQPQHMGESLKSMVLRSMAEEARKKSSDDQGPPSGRLPKP